MEHQKQTLIYVICIMLGAIYITYELIKNKKN